MKLLILFVAAGVLMLFSSETGTLTEPIEGSAGALANPITGAVRRENVPATRTMPIDEEKFLSDDLQSSMAFAPNRDRDSSPTDGAKNEIFDKNLMTSWALDDSDAAPSKDRPEMRRTSGRIAADNRALSLTRESAEAESSASDTRSALVFYEGASGWSLSGVGRIERFFRERFGRSLPISALGQSDTHDRLGLDHRGAVDVALRPNSREGRELIAHLRRLGIPYIAFQGKISSISTGAHIHIGRRSPLQAAALGPMAKRAGRRDPSEESG